MLTCSNSLKLTISGGGGGGLKACSSNKLNRVNNSWVFSLRGRWLEGWFNSSSIMTQCLTQNPIDPTPENLSFASLGESQLDFLPSPSRGEGNASLAISNQTNLTPSLGGGAGERVLLALSGRFLC